MDAEDNRHDREHRLELKGEAERGGGKHPLLRPVDAATLILIDRSGNEPALLMGKRHSAHAFMPDTYVFPGGRRDRNDSRVPVAHELHEDVRDKLLLKMPNPASVARAQGLATAAVRETYEEAGVMIAAEGRTIASGTWSDFSRLGLAPDLSRLRLVARAITPPGRTRRFDTRFFACFRDEIGAAKPKSSNELLDIRWVPLSEVSELTMPAITKTVINDLKNALNADPNIRFGGPIPFYQAPHGRFRHEVL
jgi:8-oxo-dGTP pyrophosphatase MutT (NUDIX family)